MINLSIFSNIYTVLFYLPQGIVELIFCIIGKMRKECRPSGNDRCAMSRTPQFWSLAAEWKRIGLQLDDRLLRIRAPRELFPPAQRRMQWAVKLYCSKVKKKRQEVKSRKFFA
jgi:hypothetical protein